MANLKFDYQVKAIVLSLLSCIFVMFFLTRFRLHMFCLFRFSEPYPGEPYNPLADELEGPELRKGSNKL